MVRHGFHDVAKFGHWDAYVAACKAWNHEGIKVGLPGYRMYTPVWGRVNEAYVEAEFESAADVSARYEVAGDDAAFRAALRALEEHLTDGASREYVLSEESLG
jgi:hypothetical protein